jgi:putative Mg2+ transporter-C (MgtC) family protein
MSLEQITTALSAELSSLTDAADVTRILFRLGLSAALGALLGYERESLGKSAGIRTHALVALGAALFVLAPLESNSDQNAVSRVIQGLVAGIGFLGAGAIVKGQPGEEIRGLTTAAGIWCTAAVGMTVALGHAAIAIAVTVLTLVVLRVLPVATPDPPPSKKP